MLTQDLQRRLDPFLMLDAFGSDQPDDYIAGFPDHPHRDSAGNGGLLQSGALVPGLAKRRVAGVA